MLLSVAILTLIAVIISILVTAIISFATGVPDGLFGTIMPGIVTLVVSPLIMFPLLVTIRDLHSGAEVDNPQDRYRVLLDSVPGAITYIDKNGCYQFANKTFEDWLGVRAEDIVGQKVSDVIGEEGYKTISAAIDSALARDGNSFDIVRKLEVKGLVHGQFIVAPDRDADGTLRGLFTLLTDATESQNAIDRFRDFLEISSDWYWESDSNGVFTQISGLFEEKTGIPIENIVGKTRDHFLASFSANDLETEASWKKVAGSVEKRQPYSGARYTIKAETGKYVVIEISGKPVFDVTGEYLGYRGVGHDVTEDQYNARLLKDSIETFTGGFALYDEDDRLVLYNSFFCEMLERNIKGKLEIGRTFESLLREWVDGGAYNTPREDTEAFVEKRMADHRNAPNQREHRLADGRWFLASEYKTSLGGTALVQMDISKRKEAEQALQQSQMDYQNLMEGSIQGVLITSLDRKPLFANEKCADIFGYDSAEELLQLDNTLPLIAPHELDRLNGIRQPFLEQNDSGNTSYEFEGVRKDGSPVWLGLQGGSVQWKGQRAAHLAVVDISVRRQAEEDRRLALIDAEQANQAKSDFLATMSHELRTPLNAIIGFSDMIEGQFFGKLGSDKYMEYAHDISSSSKHLLELVNDILDLSAIEAGKQPLLKENLVLGEIVADCTPIIVSAADEKDITLNVDIPDNFPLLHADRRAVKQILFNLLSNSVKYTPPLGDIILRASKPDAFCVLEIVDNGIGVPSEKLATLMDPFVRTESDPHVVQEGSGLGLAIVKSLVELHGGSIQIQSEVGVGTSVTVQLPDTPAADA